MARQCSAHRKDGTRCKGKVLPGSQFCFAHDPTLQGKRRDGAIRGGRGKSSKVRARRQLLDAAMDFDEIDGLLCLSMRRTATGQMEPSVASALASLARALVTLRTAGVLEDRIASLEHRANINGGRGA